MTTPDSVLILIEMVHDARIIPIVKSAADAKFSNGTIKKWLGESVGWYEGDTLVVQTRNVMPAQRGYLSKDGVLTERFVTVAGSRPAFSATARTSSIAGPYLVFRRYSKSRRVRTSCKRAGSYSMLSP